MVGFELMLEGTVSLEYITRKAIFCECKAALNSLTKQISDFFQIVFHTLLEAFWMQQTPVGGWRVKQTNKHCQKSKKDKEARLK